MKVFNIGKSVCLWCVNSGIFYRCWPCIEPTFSQCPCFYDTGMRRLPSLQLQRKRVSIIPIAWSEIKIYQLSLCMYVYVIFALNRQKKKYAYENSNTNFPRNVNNLHWHSIHRNNWRDSLKNRNSRLVWEWTKHSTKMACFCQDPPNQAKAAAIIMRC